MIVKTELLPAARLTSLLDEATQLTKIIGQSIVTTKSLGKDDDKKTT
jgi:hypothetical protein